MFGTFSSTAIISPAGLSWDFNNYFTGIFTEYAYVSYG